MKNRTRRFVVSIGAAVALAAAGSARGQETALEAFLEGQREAGRLPGLAAAVVDGRGFEWGIGLGWAEIDVRPVTPETPFLVASVSKPVTATALVAAVEDGLLGLDEDVRGAFSFPVAHPFFPESPVTPRQLLAHASSIVDDPAVLAAAIRPGDPTTSLRDFLAGYLAPGDPRAWSTRPPAAAFAYSNIGYALAGHLLEVRTGHAFGSFVKRRLADPAGMADSAWTLAELPRPAALPYRATSDGFVPYEPYGAPYAPAVLLRASARDLGRFLALHLAGGRVGDRQVVSEAGIAEMERLQFPLSGLQGLGWRYLNAGGRLVLGHGGSGSGVTAEIVLDRRRGRGVAVVTNVDATRGEAARAFQAILDRLLEEAEFPSTEPPPAPAARTWLVPAVIRGHRGGDVEYRTELWLANPTSASLETEIGFQPRGAVPAPPPVRVALAPGEGRVFEDALNGLFGVGAGQGTLVLTVPPAGASTPPVAAVARIGSSAGGSQWVAGEEPGAATAERWLAGVHHGDGFVATIAVQNLETAGRTVTLEAWDAAGGALGVARVELGPGGFRSQGLAALFPRAGTAAGPFALVFRGTGRFLAAATLLEATSGDSFYLPAQPAEIAPGGGRLARVVRGRGQRGSTLSTELALHNPSDATLHVRLELQRRGSAAGGQEAVTVTLEPRATRLFGDVLAAPFGTGGDGAGSVTVVAVGEGAGPVVSALGFVTTAAGLRLGTRIALETGGEPGPRRVFGAGWGAGRDSSVGLLNQGSSALEVDLLLLGPDGSERGRRRVGLAPRQHFERTIVGVFGPQKAFRGGTVTASPVGEGSVGLYLASLDEAGDVDLLLGSGVE